MIVVRDVGGAYFRRRYTILFCSLIVTMVASPVAGALGLSGTLIDWLLGANLAIAVAPVEVGRKRNILLIVMAVLLSARAVAGWMGESVLSELSLGFWTLLGLVAAGVALRFAMQAGRIDTEHLCAALSAYLLAGIYFGLLYWVVEQVHAGSFNAAGAFSRTGALYFSFVTLATLGYGDIVPRTDVTRGLAIVEGIGGQLFLAVLVARLVSLYSSPTRLDEDQITSDLPDAADKSDRIAN
jgi:hypothetical protein